MKQSLLDQARVSEKNIYAHSGKQALKDFARASFIINGKRIDKYLVKALIKGAEDERSGEAVEPSELDGWFNKFWQDHCKDEGVRDDEETESYKVEYNMI